MKTGVIYKVTNTVNGKIYIGQSINFKKRKRKHIYDSKNILDNMAFHKAINKYGESSFKWDILVNCPQQDLDTQEIYWISYWSSFGPNGYNLSKGGSGNKGHIFSKESIEKMRNAQLGKKASKATKLLMSSTRRGKDNPFSDKTIYNFYNIKTGERFTGLQIELKHLFNLSGALSNVITGKRPHYKGWKVNKRLNKI